VLHRPSGKLTYVRAAQERPLLVRQGQPVSRLPGEGRFLGMLRELSLEEYSIRLRDGDRLLMFSDGVPDAVNQQDEAYGNDRLVQAISRSSYLHADELAQFIKEDVALWSDGAAQFDDLTLLILEVGSSE